METIERQSVIKANRIATFICTVIFLFSLGVALTIDSVVLLLDSAGWLIGVITGILYEKVIKTIKKPPSARYHFGYAKIEPLSINIEALLILGACFFTIKMGIQDIIHPDEVKGYGLAIGLTLGTGIIGLIVSRYLKVMGKKNNSPLLEVNAFAWFVDSVFAFGVCGGFVIAGFLSGIGHKTAAAYIDPVMGIILALVLVPAPFKMLKNHVGELLDENPGGAEEQQINEIINQFKDKWGMRGIKSLRIRKAGTKYFIDVCFHADSEQHVEDTIKSVRLLENDLQGPLKQVDVGVRFEIG